MTLPHSYRRMAGILIYICFRPFKGLLVPLKDLVPFKGVGDDTRCVFFPTRPTCSASVGSLARSYLTTASRGGGKPRSGGAANPQGQGQGQGYGEQI